MFGEFKSRSLQADLSDLRGPVSPDASNRWWSSNTFPGRCNVRGIARVKIVSDEMRISGLADKWWIVSCWVSCAADVDE